MFADRDAACIHDGGLTGRDSGPWIIDDMPHEGANWFFLHLAMQHLVPLHYGIVTISFRQPL